MKIVRESLSDATKILEGLKIYGTSYDHVRVGGEDVYAGEKGILGFKERLIPWSTVRKLINKYANN